jgi:hypothetical protein
VYLGFVPGTACINRGVLEYGLHRPRVCSVLLVWSSGALDATCVDVGCTQNDLYRSVVYLARVV